MQQIIWTVTSWPSAFIRVYCKLNSKDHGPNVATGNSKQLQIKTLDLWGRRHLLVRQTKIGRPSSCQDHTTSPEWTELLDSGGWLESPTFFETRQPMFAYGLCGKEAILAAGGEKGLWLWVFRKYQQQPFPNPKYENERAFSPWNLPFCFTQEYVWQEDEKFKI